MSMGFKVYVYGIKVIVYIVKEKRGDEPSKHQASTKRNSILQGLNV